MGHGHHHTYQTTIRVRWAGIRGRRRHHHPPPGRRQQPADPRAAAVRHGRAATHHRNTSRRKRAVCRTIPRMRGAIAVPATRQPRQTRPLMAAAAARGATAQRRPNSEELPVAVGNRTRMPTGRVRSARAETCDVRITLRRHLFERDRHGNAVAVRGKHAVRIRGRGHVPIRRAASRTQYATAVHGPGSAGTSSGSHGHGFAVGCRRHRAGWEGACRTDVLERFGRDRHCRPCGAICQNAWPIHRGSDDRRTGIGRCPRRTHVG